MKHFKPFFIITTLISLGTITSCSDKYGAIDFVTLRADHQFFVDGEEIFKDQDFPASFGANYNVSSGGNSSVTVDYYTTYDFGVYTSIDVMGQQAVLSGQNVVMGAPITLKSTSEWDTKYTVVLRDNLQEPYWDVTDTDDIITTNPGTTGVSGKWVRNGGGSYLKISGSNISTCITATLEEFHGTYNSSTNEGVLTEGSLQVEFSITPQGDDELLVEQSVSGNHYGSAVYTRTTQYPCD